MIETSTSVPAEARTPAVTRLSICIPTFNRAHTLGRLLEALQRELADPRLTANIQIVISDNASSDDTQTLVNRYIEIGLPIIYFRQPSNLGFGKNLNHAIASAEGEYCWLMGSDDIPMPDSIRTILGNIAAGPDIILGNVLTNGRLRQFWSEGSDRVYIAGRPDVAEFISRCTEISSLFAFMSALVVKRAFWNSVKASADLLAHPYTHQIRLFSAIANGGAALQTIAVPIVDTGDEGNEWDAQIGKHFELDCSTLQLIATSVFDNDERIFQALGQVFRLQYGPGKLIRSRSCLDESSWRVLQPTLIRWGYSATECRKRYYDAIIFSSYMLLKKSKRILA